MKEIAVDVPHLSEPSLEACFMAEALHVTLRGTLKKYPGCIHWHLKQADQAGTLEATLWRERAWFKISAGRNAEWVEPCALRLKARLEADRE